MIDIHSHLIFGVDDGPASLDESILMVKKAERAGVKVVIATPHVTHGNTDMQKIKNHFKILLEYTRDFDISLKLGYEIFIGAWLLDFIRSKRAYTLADSNFMLVEFPEDAIPVYSEVVIYEMLLRNITPIIAHPERNDSFIRQFDVLMDFRNRGCMLQIDAASIVGAFGVKARRFAKKLIRKGLADFIASDAHTSNDYSVYYLKAYEKTVQWIGEQMSEKLFAYNAASIIKRIDKFSRSIRVDSIY